MENPEWISTGTTEYSVISTANLLLQSLPLFFECNLEQSISHTRDPWDGYSRQYFWFSASNNSAIAISQLDHSYLIPH